MIGGATRIVAVIGWPIEHSMSPRMLNAAFQASNIDIAMVPIGVPPEGFATAVRGLQAMRALGASVTAPHKLAAHALCDELSDAARAIGAVNCLQLDGATIVGHNTDAGGFVDGMRRAGCTPSHVTLLGAGGAARAIAHGLAQAGQVHVEVVARGAVEWTTATPWSDLAGAFRRADLVVDCTAAALGDEEAAFVASLPLEVLRSRTWVASLVYHRAPALLTRAVQLGHPIFDGTAMLVHQGARAFHIWTGAEAPVDVMFDAFTEP